MLRTPENLTRTKLGPISNPQYIIIYKKQNTYNYTLTKNNYGGDDHHISNFFIVYVVVFDWPRCDCDNFGIEFFCFKEIYRIHQCD